MTSQKPSSPKKEGFSMDAILDKIEEGLKQKKVKDPYKSVSLRKKDKPSILILTTRSFGKGHLSAARSLTAAYETYHKGKADIFMVDPFRECNKFIDQALKACYDNSVKYAPSIWGWFFYGSSDQTKLLNILSYPFIVNNLAKIIAEINPDMIISTYPPLWNLAMKRVWNDLGISPKTMNVITDSMIVHQGWVTDTTDHYIVANNETKEQCQVLNVPENRVHSFGFPVGLDFEKAPDKEAIKKELGMENTLTALIMIGTGATTKDMQLVCDLKHHFKDKLGLIVITGKNKSMLEKLQKENLPGPIKLIGWCDEVAKYMHTSDLVITKAGGATIMECIATKSPVLITKVIPGQEEGNADTILKYNLGTVAEDKDDIIATLQGYIDTPDTLAQLQQNFAAIHRKDAAKNIADFSFEVLAA